MRGALGGAGGAVSCAASEGGMSAQTEGSVCEAGSTGVSSAVSEGTSGLMALGREGREGVSTGWMLSEEAAEDWELLESRRCMVGGCS